MEEIISLEVIVMARHLEVYVTRRYSTIPCHGENILYWKRGSVFRM